MKIIRNLMTSLAVVISLSACNVHLEPTDSFTYEDPTKIFDTYSEAKVYANGLSAYFRGVQGGSIATMTEIQCDMYSADANYGNNGGPFHTMGNSFTSADQDVKAFWGSYYSAIMQCNYFLTNIKNIDEDALTAAQAQELNIMKGEATFFRAYIYHQLGTLFCDRYDASTAATELGLPIVTSVDISVRPSRSDLKTTYDFISSEIEAAQGLLGSVAGKIRAEKPTIDIVNALAARVALWTGDNEGAIESADDVINSRAGYTLASDIDAIRAEFISQDGKESIYQMYASEAEGAMSMSSFLTFAQEYPPYMLYTALYYPNARALSYYEPTDIRYNTFFTLDSQNDAFIVGAGYLAPVPCLAKYRGNPSLSSYPYYTTATKVRVFGVSEMYLIKAEAQAVLGQSGDAKSTINELQEARGAQPTDGSLENVKIEWARETIGEGHRLACLKRWNDGFNGRPQVSLDGLSYLMTGPGFNDIDVPAGYYKLTWPIPYSELETNKNLVQNPGW